MTNKPMLSVERELLERVVDNRYREKENISIARHEALWELRALLDKPVDVPEPYGWVQTAGQCINQITQERDVVEGWTAKGYLWEALYIEHPAAQHQSEPVAWVIGTADGNGADYYPGKGLDTLEIGAKLYAEQPAPVAVDPEMLERFPEINFSNYGQDEVEALQAWAFEAYDAIARLNGVKP